MAFSRRSSRKSKTGLGSTNERFPVSPLEAYIYRKRAEYCFGSTVSEEDKRATTNVQNRFVQFFYYLFFSFVILELKPFVLKGKVPGEKLWKSAKKCEKVRKNYETILPFSCCPLVFLWVLFRRGELTEPHWVLRQTRWVLRKTRWVRFGTQIIGWEELTEFAPRNSVSPEKLTEFGVWSRTPRNRIRPVSEFRWLRFTS